jgi:carbon-monoxide dehydrogenase medium subunit
MWQEYVNAVTIEQVLSLLADEKKKSRIIAGGTDLVLEMGQGLYEDVTTLIDISRMRDLSYIEESIDGNIHIGAGVTHNQCLSSKTIRENALPLALAAWEIGAPQIRNMGTIVGNLVTASPANDTIVPLIALNAELVVISLRGERRIKLEEFYTGVRKHVLRPDELVKEIIFPAMDQSQRGIYLKLGLRNAQAISLVNMAAVLTFDGEKISGASIALGAVAPTIIHALEAEKFLIGKTLTGNVIKKAARRAQKAAQPIDDIRGSADYRKEITRVLVERGLMKINSGEESALLPASPVLLVTSNGREIDLSPEESVLREGKEPINTRINGKDYNFREGHRGTLLQLIREYAHLTGSKVGCEEGECGACTVILDGMAVMSCLIPAPRAHLADIITIEGLGDEKQLHPVQESFVSEGAVQCGYCTPGFIMSAAQLLDEKPDPSQDDIKTAISGNLCRCTGYYKIIQAIEKASQKEGG